MKVYFISGLAADSRVFKYIRLPEAYEIVHLEWIPPEKKESLAVYAKRLAEKINTAEPFILLGLSMGGMIATEIAKTWNPLKTILISSIPVSQNLPLYFKAAASLGIYKFMPVMALKWAAKTKRYFTSESSEDKKLLRQVIQESDNDFIKWAIEAILTWNATDMPTNYIHIHGSKDGILPVRFTSPSHIIKDAGHMMILTNARQINRILSKELESVISY